MYTSWWLQGSTKPELEPPPSAYRDTSLLKMSAKPSCHACPDCGRRYKAAETLNRHRKNHSAIAHQCEVCDSAFKRKDLLDRHLKIHASGRKPSSRTRSHRACDRCSRLKSRCDNLFPCTRCTRGGQECTYKHKSSRKRTERSSVASTSSCASSMTSHDSPQIPIATPPGAFDSSNNCAVQPKLELPDAWKDDIWLEEPMWQWPAPRTESSDAPCFDTSAIRCEHQDPLQVFTPWHRPLLDPYLAEAHSHALGFSDLEIFRGFSECPRYMQRPFDAYATGPMDLENPYATGPNWFEEDRTT